MSFKAGQRVVCVDASPGKWNRRRLLVLGAIYCVRGIDPENGTGVYLMGVPDDPITPPFSTPRGWCPSRFRPVVERKTDISIFTAMLTKQRDKVS